jgi:TonB family protein
VASVKTFRNFKILFLLLAVFGLAQGQSGRVKPSAKKPTVAPVPVTTPSHPAPKKPKDSDLPKMVDGERVYLGSEVDTKAIILKKPEPLATSEAKRHSFHGKIVLQAILAANGQVTNITILAPLPYGLNEKAIDAARRIKFEQAIKDGVSVSEWVRIEYEFWFI